MPGLDPRSKLEIIEKLEKSDVDMDYRDVVDGMESMMERYSVLPVTGESIEGFDFGILKGMSPAKVHQFFHDNSDMMNRMYGLDSENMDKLVSGLNSSGILPYKAYRSKTGEKGSEWAFYKEIDRYEKASGMNNRPVHLRYYKDGTHDVLDEKTFNDEKHFNLLPEDMKKKPAVPIDEGAMDGPQKDIMYQRISDHQGSWGVF